MYMQSIVADKNMIHCERCFRQALCYGNVNALQEIIDCWLQKVVFVSVIYNLQLYLMITFTTVPVERFLVTISQYGSLVMAYHISQC